MTYSFGAAMLSVYRSLTKFGALYVILFCCRSVVSQSSYATAMITVGGVEQQQNGGWDSGTITIEFNGFSESVVYGQYSTSASLAAGIAAKFSYDYHSFGLYAKAGAPGTSLSQITFRLLNGSAFGSLNLTQSSLSFTFPYTGFGSTPVPATWLWNKPAPTAWPTPLSRKQLSAVSTIPGKFVYQDQYGFPVDIGSVMDPPGKFITAFFYPTDPSQSRTQLLQYITVVPGVPVITWPTPAPINATTPLSATQLNATADVPGVFTYFPPIGTLPQSSSIILTAKFTGVGYYSDTTAQVALQIIGDFPGRLKPKAGNGVAGISADGGLALGSSIAPRVTAVDGAGNIFFSEATLFSIPGYLDRLSVSQRIRKVDQATGILSTVAGNSAIVTYDQQMMGYSDGPSAVQTALGLTASLALDDLGNLYETESSGCRVHKINLATGGITTTTMTSNCTAPAPSLVADSLGNMYGNLSSSGTQLSRIDSSTGVVSPFAGSGASGYSGDGTPALNASLTKPIVIGVTSAGDVYFQDNHEIRSILRSTGNVATIIGALGPLGKPGYYADCLYYGQSSGDGFTALYASLIDSTGVGAALDHKGNLWITDCGNLRRVDAQTGLIRACSH